MPAGPVPSSFVEVEQRLRAAEALVADLPGTVNDGRLSAAALDAQYAPSLNSSIFFPMTHGYVATGSPALGVAGSRWPGYLFDAASTEQVNFTFSLPSWWLTYRATLWWANAGAGAGNVVWGLSGGQIADGGDTTTDNISSGFLTTAAAALGLLKLTALGDFSITSGMMHYRIYRLGADGADTLANDAIALGVNLVRLT